MASNIKGITIEIGGNTSGLKEALKDVDKSLSNTQKELKEVNNGLKYDPKNITLLTQKQTLLSDAIKETSKRLETLKKAKEQAEASGNYNSELSQYRELDREIESATSKLKSFKDEASNVSLALDDAGSSAINFSDLLKSEVLGNVITEGIKTLVNGIVKIGSAFASIVESGVDYNATMESYQTAFSAMLGSAEKAEEAIDNIKKSASASPFDIATLVEANQMLITTGETAEDSAKVINALGDAVAYTGGGNDVLKRMASNLQQIKNVGKASSTDIKQFAMAGINVYGILSDYLGKDIEQIKEMDISYEDLSNALIQASSEGGTYFGAMERQSTTLNGQLTLMKSNWNELTGVIAEDTTSALTNDFIPAINQALDSMINWKENGFGSLGEAMGEGISDMINVAIEKAPDLLQSGIDMIGQVVDGLLKPDEETGKTPLESAIETLVEKLTEFVMSSDFGTKLINIGWEIAKGIVKGFWKGLLASVAEMDMEAVQNAVDQYNADMSGQASWQSGGYGSQGYSSLGFGNYKSGGFASGGVTLNASFNMATTQLNETSARRLADLMADEINNKLGGMI